MKFKIFHLRNNFTYLVKTAIWRCPQSLTSSALYRSMLPASCAPSSFFSIIDRHCFVACRHLMSQLHSSLFEVVIPREIILLRLRCLAGRIFLLPLPLCFQTLLYLRVNLIKEIRVAITISPSCKFQWESWITWSCNCCLSLYVFYKFLEEPVMTNPQFHQCICNPSIIFCRWNDAKRRYPDWILTYRKFTKLVLSTTSSTTNKLKLQQVLH